MVSYTLAHEAYLKIIFHAAKHPHLPVNGVLVGKLSLSNSVIIEDAIPLLHHWTSLSPMMEISLDLSRTYAESVGMTLVGYYQACERLDDTALAPVGERVVGKLQEQFKDAIAFVIDGRDLGENLRSGKPSLIPYLPLQSSSSWRPYTSLPAAFTASSPFTLVSQESPSRAAALLKEKQESANAILQEFGDFDDHLEDTYTQLVLSAISCHVTQKHLYQLLSPMLLRGDLVHCPVLGQLDILSDYLLEVDESGFLTHVSSATSPHSCQKLDASNDSPIIIPSGSFLLPTFCDLHLHAPQFLYQGTGLHLPLMEWLNEYAFRAEERLDADFALARRVYQHLAKRLIENGTGAVLLFGTIKEETNLILADVMQTAGIRSFIGKLSMDISSRPSYVEASAQDALSSVESFVENCRALVSHLPKHRQLVEPVITPRFVPTCSNDLLTGLGAMSETKSVRIQSHLAEAHDQVEWVKRERGFDDIEIFDRNGLLTPRTIQAHCTFVDPPSLSRLRMRGTAVAHCPLSNAYFSAKPFPLREALQQTVKVGLGTDVAGGYSVDIMNAMRQTVIVSRMREGSRLMDHTEGRCLQSEQYESLSVDWRESLYLATRGGALALGLPQGCGLFEVGAPFDAQCVQLFNVETKLGVGAVDFFEPVPITDGPGISLSMLEKWWCLGGTQNRVGMWIQGTKLAGENT